MRILQTFPVCLVLLWLAAGCAKVGPDFAPPPTAADAVKDAGQQWLEARQASGVNTTGQVKPKWWETLGDPTLDRLITMATEENLTLRSAGLRVLQARATLGVAAGNLFPQQQNLTTGVTETRPSDRSISALNGPIGDYRQLDLGLTATWELDFWGRLRRGVEAAEADLAGSVAGYDDALVSLCAEVARTYVSIRTYEERLRIARDNVILQQESLRIADARLRLGATSERDVQQALTLLHSTEARIPDLESGLAQTRHAMAVLLGKPPAELTGLLDGPGTIPVAPAQVALGLPTELLRRRPDVRKAELAAWAECARLGVAKAELLPAFSLSGSIGFSAASLGPFAMTDLFSNGFTAQGGPSVLWKIFNYGRLTNAVRAQDALFEQRLTDYQQTVLGALREVEDYLAAYLRAGEREKLLAQSAASASRSVELAVTQYREGATDFTTVITAQQDLLSQQDSLFTTRGDISQSLVGLYRSLGGGWELRDGHPLVPKAVTDQMADRSDWDGMLDAAPTPEETTPASPASSSWRAPQW